MTIFHSSCIKKSLPDKYNLPGGDYAYNEKLIAWALTKNLHKNNIGLKNDPSLMRF